LKRQVIVIMITTIVIITAIIFSVLYFARNSSANVYFVYFIIHLNIESAKLQKIVYWAASWLVFHSKYC
jgi:hypothetical protein